MAIFHLQTKTNNYFDWEKLRKLSEEVACRAEEFLDSLNIDYSDLGKFFAGPCPVHGGNNRTAFNFYIDGSLGCNWTCWTHNCHRKRNDGGHGEHIFGLVCGIKNCSWEESVDYICKFLNVSLDNIQINPEDKGKYELKKQCKILQQKREFKASTITRDIVRKNLDIPAVYYIDRNYDPQILDKYDVGLCTNPLKPMYNRVVVPIYDDEYSFVQGVTGRSIYEEHECGLYHAKNQKCPSSEDYIKYAKWRNNESFNKSSYLYNYWFAKNYIRKEGFVILVEGPGDVWKLEEAGIHNSLAIFGTKLTDQQLIILEQSGAMTILVLTDMDKPGREAAQNIKNQCERLFNIIIPEYQYKDIGCMSIQNTKTLVESNSGRKK